MKVYHSNNKKRHYLKILNQKFKNFTKVQKLQFLNTLQTHFLYIFIKKKHSQIISE